MFWVFLSYLVDLFVLWLGAAMLFLIPLFIILGLWHAVLKGLNKIGECFVHVFTMHKPEEDEAEVPLAADEDKATEDKAQERTRDGYTTITQKKGCKRHVST